MAYKSIIDTTNKNNSHSIAIDFLLEASGGRLLKIIDVGCSEGYLGGYLKTLGHTVTGVEMDSHAADQARAVLDSVFRGSIQEYFRNNIHEKFDAIIFGDVLEHIANPHEILEICQNHLVKNGFIIASIPNVSHYAVRAMLLEGRWEYSDLGILDRTHLRFFTKESASQLFKDADYSITQIGQVTLPTESVAQLCNLNLDSKCVELVENFLPGDESGGVFQYIFLVHPLKFLVQPLNDGSPRIVACTPERNSSLFSIRMLDPLENWHNRYGGSVRYKTYEEIGADDIYWGDVFIFQRLAGEYVLSLMSILQGHGKKVVFEIDDLLTEIPDFLSHHRLSDASLESMLQVISHVDYVTTTTHRMAEKLLELNSNVKCVPNCAESLGLPIAMQTEYSNKKTTLIIASSDRIRVDFLAPALLKIQEQHGDAFGIVVIGPPGDVFENLGLRITRYALLSHYEFKKILTGLINPIGLIPLDDSVFSSCKSPIKFLDYALAGIPSICSNVPPYSDYVVNGATGLLVDNDTNSWIEGILSLSGSSEMRIRILQNAIAYVKQTHAPDIAGDAWQSVINELNITRVDDLELLKPETYQVGLVKAEFGSSGIKLGVRISVPNILRQLLNPAVYPKIIRVLKNEGLDGLFIRLKRI